MKKLLCVIMLFVGMFGGVVWGADVGVTLNGTPVMMDSNTGVPYLDLSGRVMIPLRAVLEKVGAHVEFDATNRLVLITTVDTEIIVPIDRSFVVVNRVNKPNDAPAIIKNGRTYLPIRIVMESLGYTVAWESKESQVLISKGGEAGNGTTLPLVVLPTAPVQAVNVVGNSSINLYNGGLIARENNWLYFINFNDNERLWRVDVTSGASNAISLRQASMVNVVNGWVYYRQKTIYNTWELHGTKCDGTEDQVIVSNNVDWLKVEGGTIYYYQTDPVGLYKRLISDKFSSRILDSEMNGISLENGYVTYAEMDESAQSSIKIPGDIVRYKLDDLTKAILTDSRSGETQSLAAVIGGNLLFSKYDDAQALYSLEIASGVLRKLTDQSVKNIGGNELGYFTIFPYVNNSLHKVEIDGSRTEKIGDIWYPGTYFNPSIHLSGDYIFYLDRSGSSSYQWIRVELSSGDITKISTVEDFMEK